MLHRRTTRLRCAFLVLCAAMAMAGEEAVTPGRGWQHCVHRVGDCDFPGAHKALADLGIEINLGFTAVWQANHRGGLRSHPSGKFSSSWDLETHLDTGKMGLWPGGLFVLYLEGSDGTGIDERYVGSMFGVNADADTTGSDELQDSEWFFEQNFGEVFSLRMGKMDATRDLDTNAFANDENSQFLNGALVNNATVPFPDYALGVQVVFRPVEWLYVAATGLDAEAEGWKSGRDTLLGGDPQWFLAAEVGVETAIAAMPGAWRVGLWRAPLEFERLDNGKLTKRESGFYASADQVVYRESDEEGDEQGLGVFARYGYAPDHYSEIEHFWSMGAQYTGLIPTRDGDVVGVGYARGSLGPPARSALPESSESVIEAYYNLAVGHGVAVTVDVQYVRHPGAEHPSSFVPGVRLHWEF